MTDLSPHFKAPELAQAIFNDVFSSVGIQGRSKWFELKKTEGTTYCRVHGFSHNNNSIDESELTLEPVEGYGTIIHISREAIQSATDEIASNCPLYFRLRITLGSEKRNEFVDVVTPLDRHLQSGFDVLEIVDFRVNEARTLPDQIDKRMRDVARDFRASLTRIAFLTAVPIVSGVSVSHPPVYKARLLEGHIWGTYVPGGTPRRMMVYHWRKDPEEPKGRGAAKSRTEVEDFSGLVKLQTRRSGVIIYILVAFLLGFFGNLAASGFERLVGWGETSSSQKADIVSGKASDEPKDEPTRSTKKSGLPAPKEQLDSASKSVPKRGEGK